MLAGHLWFVHNTTNQTSLRWQLVPATVRLSPRLLKQYLVVTSKPNSWRCGVLRSQPPGSCSSAREHQTTLRSPSISIPSNFVPDQPVQIRWQPHEFIATFFSQTRGRPGRGCSSTVPVYGPSDRFIPTTGTRCLSALIFRRWLEDRFGCFSDTDNENVQGALGEDLHP